MFDPVSNPFAIQNLLERDEPPFVAERDERPDAGFGIDTLAGGSVIKAFEVDRSLLMSDEAFAPDAAAGEFVADAAEPDAGFDTDDAQEIYAAFTAGLDQEDNEPPAAADADAAGEEAAMAEAVAGADEAVQPADAGADAIDTLAEPDDAAAPAQAASGTEAQAEPEAVLPTGDAMPSTDATAGAHDEAVAEAQAPAEPEPLAPAQPELDSEAVMQMVEAARADAYAQGLDAGRSEGAEAERPLAHKQGYDEGFAAGAAQAKAQTQDEEQQRQQQEHQAKLDQLQAVIDQLQQLAYNPDAMFEPMKKLAVHLAEQLVRGELAQSPQAISRLVDNALRELNASGDKAVIVHLHPEDLEAYRPTVANFADSLVLRPDSTLERGSVRVSLDGSVVEDLMQRRVDGLKKSLSQAPASGWRSGGGSLASRVQQGQPVDDVTIVDSSSKTEQSPEAAAADGHA